MTSRTLRISSLKFVALLLGAAGVICAYTLPAFNELAARSAYQHFIGMTAEKSGETMTAEQFDRAAAMLERARRYERSNPRWRAERGNFLHRIAAASPSPAASAQHESWLQDAEESLKQAVLHTPADAWNFYELGRLESRRGNSCVSSGTAMMPECSTARYFSATLQRASHRIFLRAAIAVWLAQYAPERATQLIREIGLQDPLHFRAIVEHLWTMGAQNLALMQQLLPNTAEIQMGVAAYLYEQHDDYDSDLVSDPHDSSCERPDLLGSHALHEFGTDDGFSEWRTYLVSPAMRVKKRICLPKTLQTYRLAAIKILMHNGGSGNFSADVCVDNHVIHQYTPATPVPRLMDWYELPFDIGLLQGKSHINVYVRVRGASHNDNFLQIRGDHDTNAGRSQLNQGLEADLSPDKGIQAGEYMIRLVLRP